MNGSSAEALAIRGNRIVAVGTDAEARSAVADPLEVRLEGRTVVPGFVDGHAHWVGHALHRLGLVLAPDDTLGDVVGAVRRAVPDTDHGAWIVGRGWDHTTWGRWPTARDLDAVAPDHPVVLKRKDGHVLWANSRAMELAGIGPATTDPAGGALERVEGRPTGLFKERAMELVTRWVPDPTPEERRNAIAASWVDAWSCGITACHDMGMGSEWAFDDLAALRDAGQLGLRFVWYAPVPRLDEVVALGLRTGMGDHWLRFGGLKVFLDGTLGSKTAHMLDPYEGDPGNCGLPRLAGAELTDTLRRAAEAHLTVAAHAIGDAAVRSALDVFEVAIATAPPPLPHRIEHAQLVSTADIPRFARLGVSASMQPLHATKDASTAERLWGDRCEYAYPWRSLVDAGALVVFGSDTPVESPDVLAGLHAAVGRDGWRTDQALDIGSALHAYTTAPAKVIGVDSAIGTLETGKLADLIVLSDDPVTTSKDMADVSVLATMIDGVWVWQDEEMDLGGPRA